MSIESVFVYGTLQVPELLQALLGRKPSAMPARLRHHRAAPIHQRPYPGLVVEPGSIAAGLVIEVDERELDVLDDFEGVDYLRVRVTVEPVTAPGRRTTWVWRLRPERVGAARRGHWSLERFVAEDLAGFLVASEPGAVHPGGDNLRA